MEAKRNAMMDEESRQCLSALVDGELAPGALGPTLDAMLAEPAARELLARYYLIGEAVRQRAVRPGRGESLRERVAAAVAAESAAPNTGAATVRVLVPRGRAGDRTRSRRVRPYAMAASLVLAGAIGFSLAGMLERPAAGPVGADLAEVSPEIRVPFAPSARAPAQSDPGPDLPAASAPGGLDGQPPSVRRRLEGYLVQHSEYAGHGMGGMHPYARVVAYAGGR